MASKILFPYLPSKEKEGGGSVTATSLSDDMFGKVVSDLARIICKYRFLK